MAHIWICLQCHGGRFRDSQARGSGVERSQRRERNVPVTQSWKKWKCGRRFLTSIAPCSEQAELEEVVQSLTTFGF